MNVMLGLILPALIGVDYGWQQKPDGTITYIVQVDAETFAEMQRTGQAIGSALPANVRKRISDYSFRVGKEPLPNQNTLPPEVDAAPKLVPTPDPISDEVAKPIDTPVRVTANYPPSNDIPGASTAPAGSTVAAPQPTTYNWGGAPTAPPSVSIPQTAAPPGSTSWAQNTVPTSSTAGQVPFPVNPNAAPGTGGAYPNSTTAATGGTYSTNTAPPSLNNGPRYTQPLPWNTPPREVTIGSRMPIDATAPPTAANPNMVTPAGATGPLLNLPPPPATASYPTGTQPGFNNNSPPPYNPAWPSGAPTSAMYTPNNNYQQPPTANTAPPVVYATAANPNPGPTQQQLNEAYYQQQQQLLRQQQLQQQQQQEPKSASNVNTTATHATTNTTTADTDRTASTILILIGFLTSLAANFYFGWNTYQLRERCRMLLTDRGAF